MQPRLIDTHCHLQFTQYDQDRDIIIKRSLEQGIGLIAVGTSLTDSLAAVRLAEQYPQDPVWAAVGVHPTNDDLGDFSINGLKSLLMPPPGGAGSGSAGKVVAVGECGLDFARLEPDDLATRQLQADTFEQHILQAKQYDKPLIIHTRDQAGDYGAYDEVLKILIRHQVKQFVMHCYSGDWARAERFLELGGYLSFTGIITFPKSDIIQEVARRAPIDRIMVETDAPFLAPQAFRGRRNEPVYVAEVVKKLAELRIVNSAEVGATTTNNAKIFFSLS